MRLIAPNVPMPSKISGKVAGNGTTAIGSSKVRTLMPSRVKSLAEALGSPSRKLKLISCAAAKSALPVKLAKSISISEPADVNVPLYVLEPARLRTSIIKSKLLVEFAPTRERPVKIGGVPAYSKMLLPPMRWA